jgi:hypothetical protein
MRTSKDVFKTKDDRFIAVSQDEKPPVGSKIWNGYDYKNQCWVREGLKIPENLGKSEFW